MGTPVRSIRSRGWRGFPWGMMLVGSAMLVPLLAATYLSVIARSPGAWPFALLWFGGGYAAVMTFFYSYAPTEVELRDEGLYAKFWWGSRLGDWGRMKPTRRPFSVMRGFMLNEPTPDSSAWRHYILTLEQGRAVMQDRRYLRRSEASPLVLKSLGLDPDTSIQT